MSLIKIGFEPFFNNESNVLILGSFPSVKSREVEFYYGNKQNKFWKVLSNFYSCNLPETLQDKKSFLTENKIALWDIVTQCEIIGSQDSTIKNYKIANLSKVLDKAPIKLIILNGGTAYNIFLKKYENINIPYIKVPSTSPANTKFYEKEWQNALSRVVE